MRCNTFFAVAVGLVVSLAAGMAGAAERAPLKVGYSDWPGWIAWQVAIDKGWIKEAGVNVSFEWLDYSASLDAFVAGQLDGVHATNGDTLVMGARGGIGVMVMITDYSKGNDMVVASAGIKSMTDLKGQKIGLEIGLVDHLLLLNGLKQEGMTPKDVSLVNGNTNDLLKLLASGEVAAIATWEPYAGRAMRSLPGAHSIYSSALAPGLIYDVLTVTPASLSQRKADWVKLIKLWDRVVRYIDDPRTRDDAVKIMSARAGSTPEAYSAFLGGTRLLRLVDGKQVMVKGPSVASLYGSTRNADAFNVTYGVYKMSKPVDFYIDPSLTAAALQ
jgi:NitT/TauT family transport system substrate-binding protein